MSDSSSRPTLNTLLSAVVATGAGTAFKQVGSLITVQVRGITTATVAIEVTVDGTNFVASGLSFTADGIGSVNGYFTAYRANVTAWTSGAITVTAIA